MDSEHLSNLQFLYLTTTGRVTGIPREIEIWFVQSGGKLYVLAERFFDTQWVKNIARDPRVGIRLGGRQYEAMARILDADLDSSTWVTVQQLARDKYGWGEGLPVEIRVGW